MKHDDYTDLQQQHARLMAIVCRYLATVHHGKPGRLSEDLADVDAAARALLTEIEKKKHR